MSKFTLPENVKPVSDSTEKVYKTHLNHLAARGFDSVQKVVANPEEVNTIIETLVKKVDDVEKRKQQARIYYSALFFVLYEHPFLNDPDNILRKGFHRFRPKTTTTGEKWLPVEVYKKKSSQE